MSKHLPMEETELFGVVTTVADAVWEAVQNWNSFAKSTTGKQLVRAIDSVGANLVEGDGRYSEAEAIHFFEIARGSAREARYWVHTAKRRRLFDIDQGAQFVRDLDRSLQMLNGLINFRRRTRTSSQVREEQGLYDTEPAAGGVIPNAQGRTPKAENASTSRSRKTADTDSVKDDS